MSSTSMRERVMPITVDVTEVTIGKSDINTHNDNLLVLPNSSKFITQKSKDTPVSPVVEDNVVSQRNPTEVAASSKQTSNNVHDEPSEPEKRSIPVDEDDSSHDDDSYFADPILLPQPQSDRRYSFSSNASVPQPLSDKHAFSRSKESDASLSLSDDSDIDELAHQSNSGTGAFHSSDHRSTSANPHFSDQFGPNLAAPQEQGVMCQPFQPSNPFVQTVGAGVPQLYPQQITRVHSVSSLVTTSSHYSSASDISVRDELSDFAATQRHQGQKVVVPSGRLSPILGEHPPSRNHNIQFASPSTVNPGPSPPTILHPRDLPPGAYPHPQPQLMTREELVGWMEATKALPGTQSLPTGSRGSFESWENEPVGSIDGDSIPKNNRTSYRRRQESQSNSGSGQEIFKYGHVNPKASTQVTQEIQQRDISFDEQQAIVPDKGFKVYWQRWVMLFYMSVLNLLSDWTCYSVAPIALLTNEAFGSINPEQLVTIFLVANAFASACEPMLLARLGLRRTVLFGALLLMIGSIIKSGGMPPIIQADIQKGKGEWRVYLGFFIVGLSQPLYQCTPALLSASWFPEAERTMATGIALNSNQLGIGFAFIFGTLLVATSDDISGYFSLLSILSTLAFLGTLFQFSDAPPTPPSQTAKVVRGTLEVNLPTVSTFFETVRNIGQGNNDVREGQDIVSASVDSKITRMQIPNSDDKVDSSTLMASAKESKGGRNEISRQSPGKDNSSEHKKDRSARRRRKLQESQGKRRNSAKAAPEVTFPGLAHVSAPSPAQWGENPTSMSSVYDAPSPMMTEPGQPESSLNQDDNENFPFTQFYQQSYIPPQGYLYPPMQIPMDESGTRQQYAYPQHQEYPPYFNPYYNPTFYQNENFNQHAQYQYGFQNSRPPAVDPYHYYYSYQNALPPPLHMRGYAPADTVLPIIGADDGAEPVLTITPHHLDINIRDDQVILSLRACLARPGFIHSLVSFTVSGIVINTLSTFMDYLVRLNGAGREYTGIVGGSFQFVIMISSLIVGQWCDKTRAYYSITIAMLVLGAFGLAQCGVSLDADRGTELRWSLVIVAALVGPLQPISTELGVDVVYPLSENTVLVLQQLFSNLLSAAFIPCFKAMKDIGRGSLEDGGADKPQYTFSFYLLIVLHAVCTVFFATFNGRYLRYEHEQEKLAEEERRKASSGAASKFRQQKQYHENESLLSSVF